MSGKDELPTEVKHAIENFDEKLSDLESVLAPFLSEEKALLQRLSPLDTAKMNLTVSYAIATLFACTPSSCPCSLLGHRLTLQICTSILRILTKDCLVNPY